MKNENKAQLLQKIKALAEQGVGGEKESAQKILDQLMKKYGISEEDLLEEKVALEWFRYKDYLEKRLLDQIIYMVMGDVDTYKKSGGRHKLVGVYCTVYKKIEIEANYEFFKNAFINEFKIFYVAFCNKNRLFPPEEIVNKTSSKDKLSKVEAFKIQAMMNGMDRYIMLKQIDSKNA